ncbi:MAG: bifunctional N(6)-L-threonylcarbamoyladenine synthase/serine/threonine protein kinase [Haloarculaceae archaeon]
MAPTEDPDIDPASADTAGDDLRRVLGIEGTAWAASAAVYDVAGDEVTIETDAYQPDSGGIHPREAAEHMSDAIPAVVERALDEAREQAAAAGEGSADGDATGAPVDAVAFSRGPGLGPCLRIAGTAARALAQRFDVPLVGVNHMVAHLAVGRHYAGFENPVCLNASGANAHVLAYRNGMYRMVGETMDTGVGNAIDKFTRYLGWSHPGGPKVERRAREGDYHELPYVVKGMDFSFSGITSAAKQAVDDGVPVEDVCRGLEETVFAMLTEVSERALSLTGRDELVLGGGVGQNARLQGMLREMCEQRGARLYVPEDRFLRDNAGMVAILGAKMAAAGDTLAVAASAVDADFRPDAVPVTWRADESARDSAASPVQQEGDRRTQQGAEATVEFVDGRVVKRRLPRTYRHPDLDERLRRERTRREARLTSEARRQGVPTPVVRDVDTREATITFDYVGDCDLREALTTDRVRRVARHLATLHDAGLVHGDPTTRNVRVTTRDGAAADPGAAATARAGGETGGGAAGRVYLVDFGLGYATRDEEDHAVDLHVFGRSLAGTADDAATLRAAAETAYREASGRPDAVIGRLRSVEGRGRYQ